MKTIVSTFTLLLCAASLTFAANGNVENGGLLYMKKCRSCHGILGAGDGREAEFLLPPPRDFASGVYKYKSSPPGTMLTRDEDIFNRITNGLPGTHMPSWKNVLNEKERWDLVAFVKQFSDMFEGEANPPAIDVSGKIAYSKESVAKGAKAYKEAKCFECHGHKGKGDGIKKLKEESGVMVWPRNLTKPWSFRGGFAPEDIYARISNGIPNTPMLSMAAPKTGSGKLSVEDRWHVVNYVISLADPARSVLKGNKVIAALKSSTLPKDENSPQWDNAKGVAMYLYRQILTGQDSSIPKTDNLVIVKALYNENEIAFLLEWDDRTKSIPGDPKAEELSWGKLAPDATAIKTTMQTYPASKSGHIGIIDDSMERSTIWWNAVGQSSKGIASSGSYKAGAWKVIMTQTIAPEANGKGTHFEQGRITPISIVSWDGSGGDESAEPTTTIWAELMLK